MRRSPQVATSYSHATCGPPLASSQLQLEPSTPVTQAQLAFAAHSGSQLQAGPPLAFLSQ